VSGYRRMRRHARQARRAGMQPMMILNPGDQLPDLVIVIIGRWAWRHRTAFAPFAITVAALAVAAWVHPHHARYWLPIAGLTLLAVILLGIPHRMLRAGPAGKAIAGVLARMWAACGIDRGIERVYAAAVVAVAGGWLSAGIAAGPATGPLPLVAELGTVVLGIPWWFHRRRRAKARIERTIAAWPEVTGNAGLPGAEILSVVVDAWGWTARVLLRRGITAAQVISRIPALESGLKLRPGSLRIFADGTRADRFVMRVIETDPHAESAAWPGRWVTTVSRPMDIGLSEDGRPVHLVLLRRNALIGGIMGSGKSGILNVIIANLAGCRDVILWGVDMKGGMELAPWAACFDRLAVTPDQATELFRAAVEKLNERATRMAAAGKRVWEPTPDDPAIIIVVDEWAELPDQAREYADSIARRGRAVAENLIAATQRPTQDAMGKGTAIRSQMDIRICLRVREPRDADLILGQGMGNSGWYAHKLTKPGEFLISDPEHTTPEPNRAYLLTDAQRDRHVSECVPIQLRPAPAEPDVPGPDAPPMAPEPAQSAPAGPPDGDGRPRPEMALWDALVDAGAEGISVAELEAACGMARRWVYYRLQAHAKAGRVVQVRRGYWRAARPSDRGDGQ
jgi:S-DNA-T family DNA segregation ATPase FtsK/SpoIIIE